MRRELPPRAAAKSREPARRHQEVELREPPRARAPPQLPPGGRPHEEAAPLPLRPPWTTPGEVCPWSETGGELGRARSRG
jgi:hypothetical protein